jgi:DNA-binding CsgD family transcriptional regulator
MNTVHPFQQLIDFATSKRVRRDVAKPIRRRYGAVKVDSLVSPWCLTQREAEVYDLFVRGTMTQTQIGEALGGSVYNINYFVRSAEHRIGAGTREACIEAWKKFRGIA